MKDSAIEVKFVWPVGEGSGVMGLAIIFIGNPLVKLLVGVLSCDMKEEPAVGVRFSVSSFLVPCKDLSFQDVAA